MPIVVHVLRVTVQVGNRSTARTKSEGRHIKVNHVEGVVCFYWIVRDSRSFSVVIVEQAAESFPSDQRAICTVAVGRLDQPPVKALMRALYVAMNDVLAERIGRISRVSDPPCKYPTSGNVRNVNSNGLPKRDSCTSMS